MKSMSKISDENQKVVQSEVEVNYDKEVKS